MICQKCKVTYESEISLEESNKLLGLCQECGRELIYRPVFSGYAEGSCTAIVSGPIFYSYFIGMEAVCILTLGVVLTGLPLYLIVKQKGYTQYFSEEQRKGAITGRRFIGWAIGVFSTVVWFFIGVA